ncbi:MAG: WG repeat-containing protein [Clostridia bacterium]|nr:WG repeat-containing protein [Clostridia bacterium]
MKRFLSFFLLLALTLTCLFVFSSCKKKGDDDDGPAARLFDESGLLCVRRDGKFGFINKKGIEVIPCEYSSADRFRNGASVVVKEKGGACSFIGTDGEPLFLRTFSSAYPFDAFDRAIVHTTEDGPAELINKAGETVFSAPEIDSTGTGRYLYKTEDGKMGAVDPNGTVVLEPKYEMLYCCYEEVQNDYNVGASVPVTDRLNAMVENGEGESVWALIDYEGNAIYTLGKGDQSSYFYNGKMFVQKKDGGFQVIDRDGNVIATCAGEVVGAKASYIIVDVSEDSPESIDQHGQCVLYDWNGEVVYDFRGTGYTPKQGFGFGANDFVVRDSQTGKYGLINLKGESVVPCEYDYVGYSDANGNAVCEKDGAYYVINRKGKTVFDVACDYLVTSDYFAGDYYLACNREGADRETYKLLNRKGKTVKSFGSEYSFGFFTPASSPAPYGQEALCVYYADGYLAVRDAETETFVIMQKKSKKKFNVINIGLYDYLNLPTYFD